MVDEDAAHGASGDGEEVGAIGDAGALLAGEPQPGLVDEGGGRQGVSLALTAELALGDVAA